MPVISTKDVPLSAARPVLRKGKYCWRIIGVESKKSQAGNPMLVLSHELCLPAKIQGPPVNDGEGNVKEGEFIEVAGTNTTDWIVFIDGKTGERSRTKFKQLNHAVSHPAGDEVDTDNPEHLQHYMGKAVWTATRTEGGPVMDETVSPAVPMMDAAGKPMIDNNYRIDQYINENKELSIASDKVPY